MTVHTRSPSGASAVEELAHIGVGAAQPLLVGDVRGNLQTKRKSSGACAAHEATAVGDGTP